MSSRNAVVIGGSAGSFAPLDTIVRAFPADFPASMFVVVHISADSPSTLDRRLSRIARVPACHPADREEIQPGHIYVAPPDHHLTIEDSKVRVLRGARENRHRPAIDPLFRTAAREYGPRLIGVILSGHLDDGSAGLLGVKRRGGITVIQDPNDARIAEMPKRALHYAGCADYVLPARDIGPTIVNLINRQQQPVHRDAVPTAVDEMSENMEKNLHTAFPNEGEGTPSVFACPECHGVLWELKDQEMLRYQCRVGHSFGPESLSRGLSQSTEAALWAAMRALEEKAAMHRRLADTLRSGEGTTQRLLDQSASDEESARIIRDMIFTPDPAIDQHNEP